MSNPDIEISDNQTRYKTEDLLAVFQCVIDRLRASGQTKHFPTTVKVKSWSAPHGGVSHAVYLPVHNSRSGPYTYRYGFNKEIVLKIQAPKHLPEKDPIRSLVHSLDGKTFLPPETVQQIAWWYYCHCYVEHTEAQPPLYEVPEVAVLRNIVDGKPFVKKTPDEKLYDLKEKHGDPRYIMGGSSRTPDYHWQQDLGVIRNYYDREWARREKWRLKIEKLGEERKAHLSFADYLRLCAHYLDANGRLP